VPLPEKVNNPNAMGLERTLTGGDPGSASYNTDRMRKRLMYVAMMPGNSGRHEAARRAAQYALESVESAAAPTAEDLDKYVQRRGWNIDQLPDPEGVQDANGNPVTLSPEDIRMRKYRTLMAAGAAALSQERYAAAIEDAEGRVASESFGDSMHANDRFSGTPYSEDDAREGVDYMRNILDGNRQNLKDAWLDQADPQVYAALNRRRLDPSGAKAKLAKEEATTAQSAAQQSERDARDARKATMAEKQQEVAEIMKQYRDPSLSGSIKGDIYSDSLRQADMDRLAKENHLDSLLTTLPQRKRTLEQAKKEGDTARVLFLTKKIQEEEGLVEKYQKELQLKSPVDTDPAYAYDGAI
jgi:hypothetical protein